MPSMTLAPRHGKPWRKDEEALICLLSRRGEDLPYIAARVQRSQEAVLFAIQRLDGAAMTRASIAESVQTLVRNEKQRTDFERWAEPSSAFISDWSQRCSSCTQTIHPGQMAHFIAVDRLAHQSCG